MLDVVKAPPTVQKEILDPESGPPLGGTSEANTRRISYMERLGLSGDDIPRLTAEVEEIQELEKKLK